MDVRKNFACPMLAIGLLLVGFSKNRKSEFLSLKRPEIGKRKSAAADFGAPYLYAINFRLFEFPVFDSTLIQKPQFKIPFKYIPYSIRK